VGLPKKTHQVFWVCTRVSEPCKYSLFLLLLAHNGDDYYVAGVAMALSLIHQGPAPAFLSSTLFDAVIGDPSKVCIPIADLPASTIKQELELVSYSYVQYSQRHCCQS